VKEKEVFRTGPAGEAAAAAKKEAKAAGKKAAAEAAGRCACRRLIIGPASYSQGRLSNGD